ncbi:MAG: hypothetical protein ABIH23_25600 [bacterium]
MSEQHPEPCEPDYLTQLQDRVAKDVLSGLVTAVGFSNVRDAKCRVDLAEIAWEQAAIFMAERAKREADNG